MDSASPPPRALDVEAWLRSPWRRGGLVAVLVFGVAALTTWIHVDLEEARLELTRWRGATDIEGPDFGQVYLRQLLYWGAWAVGGSLLLRLSAWMWVHLESAALFLALQVPLAVCVSAVAALHFYLATQEGRGWWSGRGRGGGVADPDRWIRLATGRLPRELVVYVAVLGIGGLVRLYVRQRDDERRNAAWRLSTEQLRGELAQARLGALRNQLHPHFLFNALHGVGGLIRGGDSQGALSTLSSVGSLLRTTLAQGDGATHRLALEFELVEEYLAIERVRLGDRLEVLVRREPGLGGFGVPVLLLFPLIENAIKYGIAPRPGGGRLEIEVRREGDDLEFRVQDDGPGIESDPRKLGAEPGAGIGLANTRERLAMLYPGRHRFEALTPEQGGTQLRIVIPAEPGPAQPVGSVGAPKGSGMQGSPPVEGDSDDD